MAHHPQLQKTIENAYVTQPPARKITWKVIFYVAFALAWITFFVFGISITSLSKDWFWESLTFAMSIGGTIVSTIYTRVALEPGGRRRCHRALSLRIVSLATR